SLKLQSEDFDTKLLLKMLNKDGETTGSDNSKKEVTFKFADDVKEGILETDEKDNVSYNMTLQFKVLKMDESEVK
ncbi:hypothetical protein COK29_31680, partial [Bacillus cereus]|uniref:hypothetical protein n=1 Tax=Bacillus cereus TaxID=1396 RepID=UPI000C01D738